MDAVVWDLRNTKLHLTVKGGINDFLGVQVSRKGEN